jgi:hypothetical protein
MKAVRYDKRAGGEEESARRSNIEATMPLSLSCIWGFIARCAIAENTVAVARNATASQALL